MRSPLTALAWEIWLRGRRSACWLLACLAFCSLINLATPKNLLLSENAGPVFHALFGVLMVVSFLLLFSIFNYTEYNSTREWNGFPYRLFSLPIRSWQLVALPMLLSVVSVELLYLAWLKLVYTRAEILLPVWFAVLLGAYMIFYLAAIWSLAGFRILRLLALSLGGVTSIGFACLPFAAGTALAQDNPASWFSQKRLIPVAIGLALLAFVIAWAAVSRQRCGGGHRQAWAKALLEWLLDALPHRTKSFATPSAAQFWFEWRRTGLLLPACTTFTLIFIFGPVSWHFRTDPRFTMDTLVKITAMPIVLAFAIGKGFIKAEFWTTELALPSFMSVRPFSSGDFVISKLKAAALSVLITWLLLLGFVALWLPNWADTTHFKVLLREFKMFYPNSWHVITVLFFAGFMALTWRCMVNGLWIGLSGNRFYYIASCCLQVLIPVLLITAFGLSSDAIDRAFNRNPDQANSVMLTIIGWVLALAVILRIWFAVFSWSKNTPRHTAQYLLLWLGVTLGLIALAILSQPWPDIYRLEHLYVLGAFLLFPLARLGLAPLAFARNRHR